MPKAKKRVSARNNAKLKAKLKKARVRASKNPKRKYS